MNRDHVQEFEEANGIAQIQFCMYCGNPLRSLVFVSQVTWPERAVCGEEVCGAEYSFRVELTRAPHEDSPAYQVLRSLRRAHV